MNPLLCGRVPSGLVALTRYQWLQVLFLIQCGQGKKSCTGRLGNGESELGRRLGSPGCSGYYYAEYLGSPGRLSDGIFLSDVSSVGTCVTTILRTFPKNLSSAKRSVCVMYRNVNTVCTNNVRSRRSRYVWPSSWWPATSHGIACWRVLPVCQHRPALYVRWALPLSR